jgi:predicted ATP-grasp superfamily ATP-dependent carboligase
MVTTLGNKARFHEFAEHHGFPVPRTAALKSGADLSQLATFQFPIIVKPADKRGFYLGEVERLSYISSREEAIAVCGRMLATGNEVVVQQWIEGADANIYFALFHCGRSPDSVNMFFGRKIEAYPPRVGTTAVCVAAPEVSHTLGPLVRKFIAASAYEGLGSLEFKLDEVTRRFVIIEPTVGRTDWQEEIATLNGVNLPLIAYRYETGLPPEPPLPIGRAAAWRESLRFWKVGAALGADIRVYDCYWRMNDPMPAVIYYANLASRYLKRRIARPTAGGTRTLFGKSKGTI